MTFHRNNGSACVIVFTGEAFKPVTEAISVAGGNGGDGMENRLTKLEKDVEYIQKDINIIKSDVSKINECIDSTKTKVIFWLFTLALTLSGLSGLVNLASGAP